MILTSSSNLTLGSQPSCSLGLAGIAEQLLDFAGTVVALVHPDDDFRRWLSLLPTSLHAFAFPVDFDADVGEGFFDELADGVHFAGGDDIVVRLVLLQHHPHHVHIVGRIAPVALGIDIAHVQAFLQAARNARHGHGDLARDEGFAAARGFVVEQDAVAGVQAVGFAVVLDDPVAVLLGHAIG